MGTFRHYYHEVGTTCNTSCLNLFHHVFLDVPGLFRNQNGGGAGGNSHIESQVSCPVAHDFDDGATLVGLHGVAQFIDGFHGGVGSGVITDAVVGAADVIIDGSRDTYHGDGEFGGEG